MRRWHGVIILLSAVLILAAVGTSATTGLRFDREAIAEGQWYRLVTGHLVHLGWRHALLNGAGLLLLPLIAAEDTRWFSWLVRYLVLSIGIGLALFFGQPGLEWYVGMSGVLHGLFFLAVFPLALKRDLLACVVLLLLVGKAAWEHYHGPLHFSQAVLGQPVIVAAHSYGIAIAMAYALVAAASARLGTSRK
jgi:rhomboid family GlyGly-CTERM serine protease